MLLEVSTSNHQSRRKPVLRTVKSLIQEDCLGSTSMLEAVGVLEPLRVEFIVEAMPAVPIENASANLSLFTLAVASLLCFGSLYVSLCPSCPLYQILLSDPPSRSFLS